MSSVINKIIDILVKPANIAILAAVFLVSSFVFLLNFVPKKLMFKANLKTLVNFLDSYNFILFLVIIISMFFLIVQGVSVLMKKHEHKKMVLDIRKKQETLFNDKMAWKILETMYENHPNPTRLHMQNQKVKLLSQYGLIVRASNQSYITFYDDINNPRFPFILQTVAEDRLREKIGEK
ncbi:super-infection exclusion protein B [Staphylococcus epidermidis]|nr:superinfection exclusion B family protein [Staphylococcus epidermidis]